MPWSNTLTKKLIRKIESISYKEEPLIAVCYCFEPGVGRISYKTTSYNKKN